MKGERNERYLIITEQVCRWNHCCNPTRPVHRSWHRFVLGVDAFQAARRHARADMVELLGTLPQHETVSAFQVTPFVGVVSQSYQPHPEVGEVDEVFEVPLNLFLNPRNFQIHPRVWQGVERRYFAVPYGPYYTWGATARILRMFCDVIGGRDAADS